MSQEPDGMIPREVELKLELDPGDVARLRAHPLLQSAGPARSGSQLLHAIYFDTRDRALRRAGISLRIRSDGVRRTQTLKANRSPARIALDRTEWECELEGMRPNLSAAHGTSLESLLPSGLLTEVEHLEPLFAVHVQRTALSLSYGCSEIELALDEGRIESDRLMAPLTELELELQHGVPADLFRLAVTLADTVPLRLSLTSKADRGYAATDGESPQPVKAAPVELERGTTGAAAFQTIGRACLQHFLANEAVLRQRRDPDAVHQTRVALRRLRAAVSLFKPVLADDQRDLVRADLKRMATALGEARDLDVWIAKVLEPARARDPADPDLSDLLKSTQARRDRAYETAEAAIRSSWFLRGVLTTAAWIEAGAWLTSNDPALRRARKQPIEAYAANEIDRRWKRVRKRAKHLETLTPEARHEVRIEIKKLRYATEFFHALFEGGGRKRRRRAALSELERLQELLGDLNDIAVAEQRPQHPAAAALHSDQAARAQDLLAEARSAYRRFARLEPFWTPG